MLQSLLRAALGAGFPFLMTTLGAAVVFLAKRARAGRGENAMIGFAAGVMTAAAIWSLLLPSIERAAELGFPGWLPAGAGLLLGVVFLAALDALLLRLSPQLAGAAGQRNTLLMTAITLHNIPEGMAVGLAFALTAGGDGLAGAVALALGIGIQNFPEGAAVALPLYHAGFKKGRSFLWGFLSGAVEPVAAICAALAAAGTAGAMPWLLAFAAGAMLYVVVEELVPQAHSRAGTCGFVAGFLVMMILDVALG